MSTSVTRLLKEKLRGGLSHPFVLTILLSHLSKLLISLIVF
jgi:hypothetical protein